MKHIYFFNTKSRAAVYGIGTYLRQVTDCMRSIPDVSFNIVNLLVDVPEFTREEKNGYISYDIPENYMQTTKIIDCYSRNIWFLLRPYIQLQKGDVLIFHLNYTNSNSWITWAKKDFPNCKILLTIHYQDWCFSLNGNTTYFRKQILSEKLASFSMEQKLYNDVDRIICLSHYTEKLLLHEYQIPREKIAVIYNGLKDEAVFLNREEKKKLKKKYFIREDEKIILFVGRLDDIKGVGYLIRAFRHVLDKIPESRLYIIGDGLYSKYLNDCSGYWNKVTFTGRLNK
ncbi:glycosyltransferase, partial [Parabacteroides sp. AM08-6]|uniref:glycosyltransferase n=1 Tax=Parabacteroides sp. AM08-6 TaxID=2292053 RepID=UPI000F00B899